MVLDGMLKCDKCGYDFAGLPGKGRCPECGNPYDTLQGYGIAKQSEHMLKHERGQRVTFWIKFGLLAGLGVLCIAVGGVRTMTTTNVNTGGPAWGPFVIGALVGSLFFFGALATWVTEKPR